MKASYAKAKVSPKTSSFSPGQFIKIPPSPVSSCFIKKSPKQSPPSSSIETQPSRFYSPSQQFRDSPRRHRSILSPHFSQSPSSDHDSPQKMHSPAKDSPKPLVSPRLTPYSFRSPSRQSEETFVAPATSGEGGRKIPLSSAPQTSYLFAGSVPCCCKLCYPSINNTPLAFSSAPFNFVNEFNYHRRSILSNGLLNSSFCSPPYDFSHYYVNANRYSSATTRLVAASEHDSLCRTNSSFSSTKTVALDEHPFSCKSDNLFECKQPDSLHGINLDKLSDNNTSQILVSGTGHSFQNVWQLSPSRRRDQLRVVKIVKSKPRVLGELAFCAPVEPAATNKTLPLLSPPACHPHMCTIVDFKKKLSSSQHEPPPDTRTLSPTSGLGTEGCGDESKVAPSTEGLRSVNAQPCACAEHSKPNYHVSDFPSYFTDVKTPFNGSTEKSLPFTSIAENEEYSHSSHLLWKVHPNSIHV